MSPFAGSSFPKIARDVPGNPRKTVSVASEMDMRFWLEQVEAELKV